MGQVIPERRRLSLDLHYGQGVSSFGRVARLNPQTIDLRMWRRARRPSWALPIAWSLPTLSWGSRRCLEGCDESVTLRVLWGGSARSPDPVVRIRHPGPRPTSEDWTPLSGFCGLHLLPACVRRGGSAPAWALWVRPARDSVLSSCPLRAEGASGIKPPWSPGQSSLPPFHSCLLETS